MSILAFLQQLYDAAPVGTLIQAAGAPTAKWLPYDGGTYLRSAYPDLGILLPIGTFTFTTRSGLVDTPQYSTNAQNGTLFVSGSTTSANSSTTGVLTSPDGITWTQRACPGFVNGTDVIGSLIYAGTRFVAASSAASGACAPIVSNDGITWSATTGLTGSQVTNPGLAYSPTLGRVVFANVSAAIYTLDNGSTVWTSRTGTTAAGVRTGVLWTGQRFYSLHASTSLASVSSDGITWSDIPINLPVAVAPNGAGATDGNGTVVLTTGTPGLVHTSTDHGTTWRSVTLPFVTTTASTFISYLNGRFFMAAGVYLYYSVDGLNWSVDRHPAATGSGHVYGYKAGTYLVKHATANYVYTATEDTTRFRVPVIARDVTNNQLAAQYYIKGIM